MRDSRYCAKVIPHAGATLLSYRSYFFEFKDLRERTNNQPRWKRKCIRINCGCSSLTSSEFSDLFALMRFSARDSQDEKPSRRPPPNYFSRRVRIRLFMLVAMFMLIVTLMFEAAKPGNWYWLWGGRPEFAGGPPLTDDEVEGGSRDIDTRLRTAPDVTRAPDVITAPGEPRWQPDAEDATAQSASEASPDTRLQRSRDDGWSRVLGGLASDDDERLRKMLKAIRDRQPPDEDTAQHWPTVLEQLEQNWDAYLQEAFRYLIDARDKLSDEQLASWHAAVQTLELEWRRTILPALKAAGQSESELSPEHRQALTGVQDSLDRITLAQVRDFSVFRSDERHAWFRLLEKLDNMPWNEAQKASTGRVGFIQLFEQPKQYRGKLVTVRGTAELAYRVRAPKNWYGVEHYYVFWIAPAGGPNSPIAIYSLDVPPNFPPIKDKDLDRGTTPLETEVEFTGYFFKCWAYRAHDGMRLAPLLLAQKPQWTPPVVLPEPDPFHPIALAMYLLGAAAVGATIALFAFWQGRGRSAKARAYTSSAEEFAARLKSLEENDPAIDIRETLRRLNSEESKS